MKGSSVGGSAGGGGLHSLLSFGATPNRVVVLQQSTFIYHAYSSRMHTWPQLIGPKLLPFPPMRLQVLAEREVPVQQCWLSWDSGLLSFAVFLRPLFLLLPNLSYNAAKPIHPYDLVGLREFK